MLNVNKKVLIEKIATVSILDTPTRREQCDEAFCKNAGQVYVRSADTWEKRYKVKGATIV
jgi:hypothetical protein